VSVDSLTYGGGGVTLSYLYVGLQVLIPLQMNMFMYYYANVQ